jgi:hypothetical protein
MVDAIEEEYEDKIEALKKRIIELETENKRLSRDYNCVDSLCNSMDEFGEPMKDTRWTNLGERIYEIVVEQLQQIKELEERIEALEQLLVCYRVGKNPSEALHRKLEETKQALKSHS